MQTHKYLEPLPDCAPVAGGEDDGVERVPLAVGELHDAPVHALHGRQDLHDTYTSSIVRTYVLLAARQTCKQSVVLTGQEEGLGVHILC